MLGNWVLTITVSSHVFASSLSADENKQRSLSVDSSYEGSTAIQSTTPPKPPPPYPSSSPSTPSPGGGTTSPIIRPPPPPYSVASMSSTAGDMKTAQPISRDMMPTIPLVPVNVGATNRVSSLGIGGMLSRALRGGGGGGGPIRHRSPSGGSLVSGNVVRSPSSLSVKRGGKMKRPFGM